MIFNFDVQIKNGEVVVNGEKTECSSVNSNSSAIYCATNNIRDYLENCFDLNGLYSRQVYWPQEAQFIVEWTMSKHYNVIATNHMKSKVKALNIPENVYKACLYGEIVEAEFEHGKVVKIITRLPHRFDSYLDICFAVAIDSEEARVKTVWLNNRNDNHSTICVENYVRK